MQTFSNMRRNSTYKQTLLSFFLFLGFYIYESIASMQMWLPPLIGVCLVLFIRFGKDDGGYRFLAIIGCLAFIESENALPIGSLLVLFLILSLFVIPRIQYVFNTIRATRIACVILAYVSLYIGTLLLDVIMGSSIAPNIMMILYYIVIEIVIVMFL